MSDDQSGKRGKSPRVSVTLSEEESSALKAIAASQKRSESFVAAEAMRFWLSMQASENPGIAGRTSLKLGSGQ
jgi:predicted transcriptional regulator